MEIINKIIACIEQENYSEALDLILKNHINLSKNIEFMKAKAMLCIRTGEYSTALSILKQAIEISSNDEEVYLYLRYAYSHMMEIEQQNQVGKNMIFFHTDQKDLKSFDYRDGMNLFRNREVTKEILSDTDAPLVTICLLAYNNLEKSTKYCVECLLEYTQGIDYELILIDNGFEDWTFEFFKSVPHPRKKFVRVTKNIRALYGSLKAYNYVTGKYFINLANDVLVTKNWLKNLLICVESDPKIAMACPRAANTSNHQNENFSYYSGEKMQAKAAVYNISDSLKWEERMRLLPVAAIYRKECIDIARLADYGFIYNFVDDDASFRFRRAGYKLILCSDVFVHHEGSTVVGKNQQSFNDDLQRGKNFLEANCQVKCDTSCKKTSIADFQPKHFRGLELIRNRLCMSSFSSTRERSVFLG